MVQTAKLQNFCSCSSFFVVDIPFVTQRLIFGSVEQTRVSPVDKVFDVPFCTGPRVVPVATQRLIPMVLLFRKPL